MTPDPTGRPKTGGLSADHRFPLRRMESFVGGCVGEKLAPFNPSGDEVIRMAIDMLQVPHKF